MIATIDRMFCGCGKPPRDIEIGEGALFCGICKGPITIQENINPEIAVNAINQQARINELLTEILRLQAQVYRLTQSLDPR